MGSIVGDLGIYLSSMATNSTLLCIHRHPAQLALLREKGYELVIATSVSDGLKLLMSRPVDAIVLEYLPGLLDSAVVAAKIKKVNPQLPIVMLADPKELPEGALQSVDALVTKADGAHFLWATLHFVLNVKPAKRPGKPKGAQPPAHPRSPGGSLDGVDRAQSKSPQMTTSEQDEPFSLSLWSSIWDGSIEF